MLPFCELLSCELLHGAIEGQPRRLEPKPAFLGMQLRCHTIVMLPRTACSLEVSDSVHWEHRPCMEWDAPEVGAGHAEIGHEQRRASMPMHTLSLRPSLHSGMPDRKVRIFRAPMTSDRTTVPLLFTSRFTLSTTSKNTSFFLYLHSRTMHWKRERGFPAYLFVTTACFRQHGCCSEIPLQMLPVISWLDKSHRRAGKSFTMRPA